MPAPRGTFIWYDVMTSDTKRRHVWRVIGQGGAGARAGQRHLHGSTKGR
jgi:hypothetical protein